MRHVVACFLVYTFMTVPLAAEHRISCLGLPPMLAEPAEPARSQNELGTTPTKVDFATSTLLLPYFEVDTTSASGTTTLYAVRNVTDTTLVLSIQYFDIFGLFQTGSSTAFTAQDTLTVNLRDVPGLATDADGFKRGYAVISASLPVPGPGPGSDQGAKENGEDAVSGSKGIVVLPPGGTPSRIVGDYFQLIPGEDFATGDRLLDLNITSDQFSLCSALETRVFDGGAFSGGTDLTFFISGPGGAGELDPPSFSTVVYDEDGAFQAACVVRTDQVVLQLSSSDFPVPGAGTLAVFFENQGALISEFNALGRFSVGMRAACKRLQASF